MVLFANLTADDRRIRGTGPVGPWSGRFDPPSSDAPDRSGQRLACLAGAAKLRKATTVNAGEGS
ncbi:MAG: hypothetical protein ACRYGP_04675 [Janthinobacterium lividum]